MTTLACHEPRVRRALILAAGMGRRLIPHTATRPKCLLEVGGFPLLHQFLEGLRSAGVDEWVIVVGYRSEIIKAEVSSWNLTARTLRWVVNREYRSTNTLSSVAQAAHELRGEPFLLLNGDLWIQPYALEPLVLRRCACGLLVDRSVPLDQEAMKVILDMRLASWVGLGSHLVVIYAATLLSVIDPHLTLYVVATTLLLGSNALMVASLVSWKRAWRRLEAPCAR